MNLHRLILVVAAAPSSAVFAQTVAPTVPITTAPASTQPAPDPLPRSIQLKSGERVTGIVIARTDDSLTVDSAVLGEVTIKTDNIDQIIGPDGKPEGYVEPTPPVDPGLFGTGFLAGWTRQLEAGLTGTSGTTDSLAGNVQFNASVDNAKYRATLGAFYFVTQDSGDVTRDQARVFGTFDRRIDDGPWFLFARAQYDYDALQNWENRASLFGGPGYEFIRNEKYELLGRVGLGYTHEFGGDYPDGYDQSRFEGLVGIDSKWVIDPTQSLVGSIYYFPTLEDLSYGRVTSTVAYQIDLNQKKGIAFKAGIEHTNEFRTAGDDEHNNLKYFMNVVLKL